MKKKKNSAYTLIELLLTIAVIGVLAAILIPVLFNIMPGKDKGLVRKCYYSTKSILYYMLNDASLYYTDDRLKGQNITTFITTFKSYLKTNDSYTVTAEKFARTSDNVDWYRKGDWTTTTGYDVVIYFDINGSENTPNCTQYSAYPTSYKTCTGTTKPDTFAIGIRYDGKLSIFPTVQTYMASILSDQTNIKRE